MEDWFLYKPQEYKKNMKPEEFFTSFKKYYFNILSTSFSLKKP